MISVVYDRGVTWASSTDEAELRAWLAALPETATPVHALHCVSTGDGVRCSVGVIGLPEPVAPLPTRMSRAVKASES